MEVVKNFDELRVFRLAFDAANRIYDMTRRWPAEEWYGMTAQVLASSRSVGANIAEAWRKRDYQAWFIAKLMESAGEASETRVWIKFAGQYRYITAEIAAKLSDDYDHINAQLFLMIADAASWCGKRRAP